MPWHCSYYRIHLDVTREMEITFQHVQTEKTPAGEPTYSTQDKPRLSCVRIKTWLPSILVYNREDWPRGYKTFFMLNTAEHEFFQLINVEMPTIVGISAFMSRKNSIPGLK